MSKEAIIAMITHSNHRGNMAEAFKNAVNGKGQ